MNDIPCAVTMDLNQYMRELEKPAPEITDTDITNAIERPTHEQWDILNCAFIECHDEFVLLSQTVTGSRTDFQPKNAEKIIKAVQNFFRHFQDGVEGHLND